MKRIYQLIITPFLFLVLTVLFSCEEKNGKVYLRIYNSINTEAIIIVKDSEKEIPIDGNYHEVSGYLGTEYKLLNVVWDSLIYRTPTVISDTVWRKNETVNRYFGDFEKMAEDNYCTLTLNYKIEHMKPVEYPWLKTWLNIIFKYSDNSTLSCSPTP